MKYNTTQNGIFQKVNRFIAEVIINEKVEKVHVKNTGRLKELLMPGAKVVLESSNNPNRKTKYSLIAVQKEAGNWVNIDSQAPNQVAYNAILEGKIRELGEVQQLKREVSYGHSRFDLYFETKHDKGFIEVKGVTLEKNGIAMFPDAPTTRGTKHILELVEAVKEGYRAAILFIVQMKGTKAFTPNRQMDLVLVRL